MIDSRIFQLGATAISVAVVKWKSDKKTPALFRCEISHEGHNPSKFAAERDTSLAAERECVESFINYFSKRSRPAHEATLELRPADKPLPRAEKTVKRVRRDDSDY